MPRTPTWRNSARRPSRTASLLTWLCLLAAAAVGAPAALAQGPSNGLVNVLESGASTSLGVYSADVTPDGRFVVFVTASPDLAPKDSNNLFDDLDIFVRDRRLGRTVPVSVNSGGTDMGAGRSSFPVITPDGRYVAFISDAPDLVSPDPGGSSSDNVYLRDMLTGKTVLVSVSVTGDRTGSVSTFHSSSVPPLAISDDGRYVCFRSHSTRLHPNDTNTSDDIFVRDVKEGRTILVSVNQAGTAGGNSRSNYAVMTPDGRFVAFHSEANDLVPNDNNFSRADIFVRDLQAGTTKLVSANRFDGASGNDAADARSQGDLAISDDGRFVAFVSSASDLVPGDNNGQSVNDAGQDVFVRDTVAGTTELVSANKDGNGTAGGVSGSLRMTHDGRFVAFVSSAKDLTANDTNEVHDVYLRDLQTNTTTLVTATPAGTAAGVTNLACEGNPAPLFLFVASRRPALSDDGRFVTFVSAAADLTGKADANCFSSPAVIQDGYDVFVRDVTAGTTRLASLRADGTAAGDHASHSPRITPDGAHVLFLSGADDLSANDVNGQNVDAFVNVNLPRAGQVQFSRPVFDVSESGQKATVSVTRIAGSSVPVTVNYTTLGGAATPGSEFVPTSGTLTFAPGETLKQFEVALGDDDSVDEDDEAVFIKIGDETGATEFGEPAVAAVVIRDDDASPLLTVDDASVGEGDSGSPYMTFRVSLSEVSARTITAFVTTQPGTATAGTDFEQAAGTLTLPPGFITGFLRVRVRADTQAEQDETFSLVFMNAPNAQLADPVGVGTIVDDDGAVFSKVQLDAADFAVAESAGKIEIPVKRTGDISKALTVNYITADFLASSRTDYTAAAGLLRFAPNEASKTITIFVTDDALRENDETFMLWVYEPEGGTLGANSFAFVNITSEDASDGPSPILSPTQTPFFVRQHYVDFFNREPDAPGLAHWTNVIESCGSDVQCREVNRINVSGAFFLSIEFQQTGYLVERLYKTAFGDAVGTSSLNGFHQLAVPIIRLEEFVPDMQRISQGVVVLADGWEAKLEANKAAFVREFVQRERFIYTFPSWMTPAQFVDELNMRAGNPLDAAERQALVGELTNNNTPDGRASVLRKVAEDATLEAAEKNRAFVLMQYFGYLRRNPNSAPDFDYTGYDFWLGNLERFNGNFVQAELVK
ncbi:MAG TPA: Calx-beta domain-containing protein, partial [Pyrinomonadaceae bacterium]|nr:Calx-beta domain-containing protein [Pyrinomonadaceae bacterium]